MTEAAPRAQRRGLRRPAGAVAGMVVCALITLIGSASVVMRASAAMEAVDETGRPGHLVLRSDPGAPHWADLQPGDTARWLIEASLEDAEVGALSLELRAEGDLVDAAAMTVEVDSCRAPFRPSGADFACEIGARTVLPVTSLAEVADGSTGVFELADLHRGSARHLLVSLALAPSADPGAIEGATARIGVGLHAAGTAPDDAEDGRSENGAGEGAPGEPGTATLATTGSDLIQDVLALSVLGVGLIGLGLSVALWRRTRDGRGEAR